MLLTSPAPAIHYDRSAVQRQLNNLAIDLSRHDAQLESMVRDGNTVGSGWSEWFNQASHELLRGRDAYVALQPQDHELAARLGSELIDFTENGGRISSAQERGTSLGHGWSSALDSTISVVQEAASRLYSQPQPPYGGSGLADAARAAADLARDSRTVIDRIPAHDRGSEMTKSARLEAYDLNMRAQQRIEPLFSSVDQATASRLRAADARLEDANWQLTNQHSPDGRFRGVDIPGARRDTDAAIRLLHELVDFTAGRNA